MTPGKEIKIVICDDCNGKGFHWAEEANVPEHTIPRKHHFKTIKRTCSGCHGTGRLLLTITTEVEPFG